MNPWAVVLIAVIGQLFIMTSWQRLLLNPHVNVTVLLWSTVIIQQALWAGAAALAGLYGVSSRTATKRTAPLLIIGFFSIFFSVATPTIFRAVVNHLSTASPNYLDGLSALPAIAVVGCALWKTRSSTPYLLPEHRWIPKADLADDRSVWIFTFIRRAWLGKAPLWKVFWFGGPIVGAALSLLLTLVLPEQKVWRVLITVAVGLTYGVWVGVALWRCAYNVTNRFWGDLARAYVVAAITIVAVSFLR